MPTYEYECIRCNYRFDEFQKITDKALTICPKCKGKLRRLITGGVGLIFKGSGFYITDYKKSHLPQVKEKESKELKKPDKKAKVPAKIPSKQKDKK